MRTWDSETGHVTPADSRKKISVEDLNLKGERDREIATWFLV